MSVGAIYSAGATSIYGGPAQSKAIVEATLAAVAEQQAINKAPLKVPDARQLYAFGREVDLTV